MTRATKRTMAGRIPSAGRKFDTPDIAQMEHHYK